MSQLPQTQDQPEKRTGYWRFAVWIAIGALLAAAIVCVVWVLIGSGSGIIPRAFLTILLLAAFAGVALLDASLADKRPQWYSLLSMIGWVVILLAGAVKIWAPSTFDSWDAPAARLLQLLLIVLIVRLAILHNWLYLRSHLTRPSTFNAIVVWTTIALVAALAIMLLIPLTFTQVDYGEFYWRVVVALTILAAVGTAIVPLVRALTAPRRAPVPPVAAQPGYAQPGYAQSGYAQSGYAQPGYAQPGYAAAQPEYVGYAGYAPLPAVAAPAVPSWPTYADGLTPLPVLPDGSPDWNAYYTGYPTYPQASSSIDAAPAPAAEVPSWPAPTADQWPQQQPAQPDWPQQPSAPAEGTPPPPPPVPPLPQQL